MAENLCRLRVLPNPFMRDRDGFIRFVLVGKFCLLVLAATSAQKSLEAFQLSSSQNKLQGAGAGAVFIPVRAAQPPPDQRKYPMKALALSSVLAVGLFFAGFPAANAQVYNSKTTQNVSIASSSSGDAFDGTYLSSKGGSGLSGPTVAQAGKTDPRVACSHRSQMSPEACASHCPAA